MLPDTFEGTWQTREPVEELEQRIQREIDAVVGAMVFWKRTLARRLLRETMRPCQRLAISESDETLTISCDEKRPAVSQLDGRAVRYQHKSGHSYELSQRLEGETLVQEWRSEEGFRRNTYAIEDGMLLVETRIESRRLPQALSWEQIFLPDP